jgi:RES domain-containing protein
VATDWAAQTRAVRAPCCRGVHGVTYLRTCKPFLTQSLEGLGAKNYGGRWNSKGVRGGSSLGLRVPASVLPSRSNVLLNTSHPEIRRLREVEGGPFHGHRV